MDNYNDQNGVDAGYIAENLMADVVFRDLKKTPVKSWNELFRLPASTFLCANNKNEKSWELLKIVAATPTTVDVEKLYSVKSNGDFVKLDAAETFYISKPADDRCEFYQTTPEAIVQFSSAILPRELDRFKNRIRSLDDLKALITGDLFAMIVLHTGILHLMEVNKKTPDGIEIRSLVAFKTDQYGNFQRVQSAASTDWIRWNDDLSDLGFNRLRAAVFLFRLPDLENLFCFFRSKTLRS